MRLIVRRSLGGLGLGTLNRLVLHEVLPPTLLGFMTYTFLLMMRSIFRLMEQIFVRGVPATDALRLLWVTMPHLVVLTLPMSFLFGVLIAVGRMNADSEVTALQAGGVSVRRLLRPILFFAFLLVALNGYLTLFQMPNSNRTLRELKTRLFSSSKALSAVEPRVFFEGFPNLLLYVWEVEPESGYWRKVLLYDRSQAGQERMVLAGGGRLVTQAAEGGIGDPLPPGNGFNEGESGEPWLRLENVVTHQFSPQKPETYHHNLNQTQMHKLFPKEEGTAQYSLGMRERPTAVLLGFLRADAGRGSPTDERAERRASLQKRQAEVELHKRVALPCASLVFGLIGLPLGIGTRSGGRGRGFLISLGVILFYYVTNNHGELLALEGRVPVWFGVWLPNIFLAGTSLVLMRRMGRWLGEQRRGGGWFAFLVRRLRRRRLRASSARSELASVAVTGSIPAMLQRRRLVSRFPALLDRYVASRLMGPLLMVLMSSAALYIVVDLADRIDEIGKHKVALGVVLAYYWNLIPQVILDVTPFGLMIAVLILLTLLEKRLELTAVKAAGVSLYRIMVPILIIAVVCTGLLWLLQESTVPKANRNAKRLQDRIKGREVARSYAATDRQWLFSRDGTTLYNFLRFDVVNQTLLRFTMFRIDERLNLRFHLFADRVRYLNGSWVADSGWFRQIYPDGADEYRTVTSPLELAVSEGPGYFGQEHHSPAEMSFSELGAYIGELEASGYSPGTLRVRWLQKLTYPLSALIMVFLALPMGLNRGQRRLTGMQGVALALGLGIAYFVLVAVFGKMGEADLLPPLLGAWAPTVLALLYSLNRMTTLRT